MNTTYWIGATILIIIAFAIILPPLWKKREIKAADSDQRNIDIAQERVKELKAQFKSGTLTQQQYDEQFYELELTLGDDLSIQQQQQEQLSSQGRWVVPVLALSIPLLSVITYYSLGEPDALIKAEMKQTQHVNKGSKGMSQMVVQLAKRLKENPNNAKDWILLGRSFKHLKQYKLAANSFKKAHELLGDEPEVLLHYADTLAMINNGSLAGKASELVFKALEKSPNDVTGLWLAGMAKAEQQKFDQALSYWRRLQGIVPKESDSYSQIQQLITMAESKLSGVAVTQNTVAAKNTDSVAEPKAAIAVSISVKVEINASIVSKVNGGDTVFIYAKALTGPPMPLAIVRKQVADLPLTVTLDDKMAMMPSMKLSNFKSVKVMARVSKSGAAMPQKGDYFGAVELSEITAGQTVMIVINEQI